MSNIGPVNPPPTFAGSAPGLVPNSAGGSTNFLRADGAFAVPAGGGGSGDFIKIGTTIVTAASQTSVAFSSIPATYTSLVVKFKARSLTSGAGTDDLHVTMNGDGATNYNWNYMNTSGLTNSSNTVNSSTGYITIASVSANGVVTGCVGAGSIEFPGYSETMFFKPCECHSRWDSGAPGSQAAGWVLIGGIWRSTAAINSLTFVLGTGAGFVDGSQFSLYGVK